MVSQMVCFPAVVFRFLALQSKNQSWSIWIWCSCRPDQPLPIRLWIASYFQTVHCARSSRRLCGWGVCGGSHGCRPHRAAGSRPSHSLHRQGQDNGKVSAKETSSCKAWHSLESLASTYSSCFSPGIASAPRACHFLSWTLNTHDDTHNPCA